MFCEKCGTALEDGAVNCPNCGEVFGGVAAVEVVDNGYDASVDAGVNVDAGAVAKAPINKNKIIGIAAAAVVVIVAVILVLVLFTGGAKKAAKKLLDFSYNAKGSAKSVVTMMYPDEIIEEFELDKDELIADAEENQEENKEELEEDDIEYEFNFLSEKDLKASEIKDMNEMLEDYELEISKGVKFKVKVTMYEGGDKEDSETEEITMVKIGGSWYNWDVLSMYAMLG